MVVRFPGRKSAFKELLAEPRQALNFYLKELEWLSDFTRLREDEQRLQAHMSRLPTTSLEHQKALVRVQRQLQEAIALEAQLRERLFDVDAWARTWLDGEGRQ